MFKKSVILGRIERDAGLLIEKLNDVIAELLNLMDSYEKIPVPSKELQEEYLMLNLKRISLETRQKKRELEGKELDEYDAEMLKMTIASLDKIRLEYESYNETSGEKFRMKRRIEILMEERSELEKQVKYIWSIYRELKEFFLEEAKEGSKIEGRNKNKTR